MAGGGYRGILAAVPPAQRLRSASGKGAADLKPKQSNSNGKIKRSKDQKIKRSKDQKIKRSKDQKIKRSKDQKIKRSQPRFARQLLQGNAFT
ncbi:hypothetical protein [Pseudomonas sp. ZB1P45]|uniref:hypothetical protein n=1 Tax=Pseudomonas frigoris TaxID=3398356 RepID=UPI0039F06B12